MKRWVKMLLGLNVVIAIAAVYIFNPRLPTPTGEQSAALYQQGALRVASERITLTETVGRFRWFRHPDRPVCPMLLSGLDREDTEGQAIITPDPGIGITIGETLPCTMETFERTMRPAPADDAVPQGRTRQRKFRGESQLIHVHNRPCRGNRVAMKIALDAIDELRMLN